MSALKTGKLPARPDDRDLKLAAYLDTTVLPKPPAQFGHDTGVYDWRMLANGPDDTVTPGFQGAGDCVFAGACHETMMWTSETGSTPAAFTGREAIAAYSTVTGYKVGDASTDRGTDVRNALNWRRKTGLKDAHGVRHRIGAYLAIEPGNLDHIAIAMYLFGAVGIGIEFPMSAMDQFNANKAWTVVRGASIDGGHYIPLVARRHGYEWCVTWAREQAITGAFLEKYCDEAYAILSPEHLHGGRSPEGLDLAQLNADLKALA